MKLIDSTTRTNWKFIAILGLVAVVLSVVGILLFVTLRFKSLGINPIASAQCRQLEQEIDAFIRQATYCKVGADCVVPKKHLPGSPPCDCLYAVSKNYTDSSELENAVQSWNTDCREDIVCEPCAPLPTFARCEQNRCVGGWNQDNSVLATSTWQTYRNEDFGFEVRYPSTWLFNPHVEYGEIPSLDIHISNFGADDAPGCELGYAGLDIQIGGGRKYGRKGEDFETFVRSYVQTERELGMPSGKIEKIQTTNYVGFRIEDSGWDSGCKGPGYLIDQGQQRYVYVFTVRQDIKDQIYIDKILSTFRFIE